VGGIPGVKSQFFGIQKGLSSEPGENPASQTIHLQMPLEQGEIRHAKLTLRRPEVHPKDHEEIHLSFHRALDSGEYFASPLPM
jgi:hypothetical protein